MDASVVGMLLRTGILVGKVCCVVMFIILLRWALPRFRFDQLMGLAWKGLIPLAIVNVFLVAVFLSLGLDKHWLAATALLVPIASLISTSQLRRSWHRTAAARNLNSGMRGVTA